MVELDLQRPRTPETLFSASYISSHQRANCCWPKSRPISFPCLLPFCFSLAINIPTDIIYSAIDSVGDDVPTLKSLSLTSKLFSEYGQRRLLRHPTQTIKLAEAPILGPGSLGWLLEEKPHLATTIKSLSLTFSWHKTDVHVLEVSPIKYIAAIQTYLDCAGPLLKKLTNIESLRVESIDYYEIIRHCNTTLLRWVHHLSSPNLTSISMANLPFTLPSSLRSRAPQLRTIISDCAPIPITAAQEVGVPDANSPSPVYLQSFQLTSTVQEAHQYVGEPEPNELFNHPAEITLSFKELPRFTFGSLSHLQHGAAAHTLTHLIFQVPEHSSNIVLTCEHSIAPLLSLAEAKIGADSALQPSLLISPNNRSLFKSLKVLERVTIQVSGYDLMVDARQRAFHAAQITLIS